MLKRLRVRLRKKKMEQELDEEMISHLERMVERNIAQGMTQKDARSDAPGKNSVCILSYGFWQRRFGGGPQILGQTLGRLPALQQLPRLAEVGVNPTVLAFTAALAVLTGLLFGLAPALRAYQIGLQAGMREGMRGSASSASRRLNSALADGGRIQSRGSFPRQAEIGAAVRDGGTIDIRSMAVDTVTASVEEGGRVFTMPQTALFASVVNGGQITYWGDARVESSIRNGGDITKGTAAEADMSLSELSPPLRSLLPLPSLQPIQPIQNPLWHRRTGIGSHPR